ncbi:MAG: M3 family metallopeptidase [Pseudomonadota bacterium]
MTNQTNPAIFNWNGPLGLPRFDAVETTDFAAAFDEALAADRAAIDAIADLDEAPTFDNTVVALELSSEKLDRVSALFWNLTGTVSDETLRAVERDMSPRLSRHRSQTAANGKLFARIDALHQQRDALAITTEQVRVLEKLHKWFVLAGASLEGEQQTRFAAINARLAELGTAFAQNILADERDWALVIEDEAKLSGLPAFLRDAMASAATERGHDGKHAVTLSRSIIEPFLTFSDDADLRAEAFAAWQARGENGGETDNRANVAEIVALRREKADLLGYASFADMKLEDQMAKTPAAVMKLLETVWEKAVAKAAHEEADLSALAASEGVNDPVRPADWRYWAEKQRARLFDYDEAEVKPFLSLDAMIAAAFDVAGRLFGVTFEEREGVPTYHPDVRVFEVLDADGAHRATFLADYFARASKRSGAWMSGFQSQHKLGDGQAPIIVNVMNFAKAPEGQPTLLSMDDARTLFHEFGHALHGMLSDVTHPTVSGTSVARDFVELPSQLYEHWLTVPEILAKHARHVETGEAMPQALLDKVLAARTFNAGFGAVEFTSSALVDMAFHTGETEGKDDPIAFEQAVLERIGMPNAIAMRHRTPHFAHVFAGDGYSAGYYSYMWSEVLDADAFTAFEETGNVFDPALAGKLREHIYSAGGSVDPAETYRHFRGRMPGTEAMIEKRGLAA